MSEEMVNVKCFDLRYFNGKRNKAVFLKTESNCYFIGYFSLFLPEAGKDAVLILKDFYQNKGDGGEKAYFGQAIRVKKIDLVIKAGDCFRYRTARGCEITEKIKEIKFGKSEQMEKHFLDTIKKMSEK